MNVYILFHIEHAFEDDGSVRHTDENGVLTWDEQAGDEVRRLGTYSSEAKAQARIERARLLPGFRDEPDCFYIAESILDTDEWAEGFGH
ncbi:hypothetical protein [Dactylosporangium sp. NPDC049140]|uniref:hypothetical protein n=1 Tax=Dactylosporangium sp. NPDC049140 TaxID=3155647 RepID=UPI0033DE50CD